VMLMFMFLIHIKDTKKLKTTTSTGALSGFQLSFEENVVAADGGGLERRKGPGA
jgi:hypothetical protein